MLKDAHFYRRSVMPITLVALLFAFVPAAYAASSSSDHLTSMGRYKKEV
jgi:hypothetical protein